MSDTDDLGNSEVSLENGSSVREGGESSNLALREDTGKTSTEEEVS